MSYKNDHHLDSYIPMSEANRVRIFPEGDGYAIDAANDFGYTEEVWNQFNEDEFETVYDAIRVIPEFLNDHGLPTDFPVVVQIDGNEWKSVERYLGNET